MIVAIATLAVGLLLMVLACTALILIHDDCAGRGGTMEFIPGWRGVWICDTTPDQSP